MTALSAVRIRPMHPEDQAFVCSSWKQAVLPRLTVLPRLSMPDRHAWALLNHVVDHVCVPRSLVLVAYSPGVGDDPELLHAWIAVQGPRLTYAYTKPKYRHMGLHRLLREEAPSAVWSGFDAILELEQVRSVA